MPFVSVYIHFVWRTKRGIPYFSTAAKRTAVWRHIRENAEKKAIYIDFVNGYTDHCHCLISLNSDQTMSSVMQLIKGESSHWINQSGLCDYKFEWQNEYYAVSVSDSQVDKVREYIRNQEKHHNEKTFNEEVDEFAAIYGFAKLYDISD
ncbi:transposase [Lentimicrobium sp.]|uniref:transposase n=1 Tax=Lentimicrobium sp. TaxID=2034841 RepID=UPI00345E0F8B